MSYLQLTYAHLATVLAAFVLGTGLLIIRKGTPLHKMLGKIYMVLMLVTAIITSFMSAEVGIRLFDHFGFIHLFSALVFYAVPVASYFAAKSGNILRHKKAMLGLYIGGILIAGFFAFLPGRSLHILLFA